MEENIIKFISQNRVSTTEVADALGKTGEIEEIKSLSSKVHCVGKVRCIFAANESNYDVHEQIRDILPGEIVIIFTHNCKKKAIIGDLISRFILFYKQAEAIVVIGGIRDVSRLKRENYKIWYKNITPIGCVNEKRDPFPYDLQKKISEKFNMGIATCDDGGVVIIPPNLVDEETLERIKAIEVQEDIWGYCLNSLGWDTKKIVIEKAYNNEFDKLPTKYQRFFKYLKNGFKPR